MKAAILSRGNRVVRSAGGDGLGGGGVKLRVGAVKEDCGSRVSTLVGSIYVA